MKVGLIDVDGHNFPNLPLMKISAFHKREGDSVEWYQGILSGHMGLRICGNCCGGGGDNQVTRDKG